MTLWQDFSIAFWEKGIMGLYVGEEEPWVWVDSRDLSLHLGILLGLLKSVGMLDLWQSQDKLLETFMST